MTAVLDHFLLDHYLFVKVCMITNQGDPALILYKTTSLPLLGGGSSRNSTACLPVHSHGARPP
jgi:hypothetical protein